MSKYSGLFGNEPVDAKKVALADIEDWRYQHPQVQTSSKRIHYILNGVNPSNITASQISDIGIMHVSEATEANKCVDKVVAEFADMKESLKPAESLILEALSLIEGGKKVGGLRGLLMSFKTAVDPSPEETRNRVKAKIEKAVDMFMVKVPVRVEPFISGLDDALHHLAKITEGVDNTINTLDYLIYKSLDPLIKDLAMRRKEMFAKSFALMMLNRGQLESMQKICEQKKAFIEELKMTVIPVIENVMRTSVITGNENLGDIKDVLRKLL